MPNAYISGMGGFVPPRVIRNDELASIWGIDTTDEWIHQRSGIHERRFADEGVGSAELGYEAAKIALDRAKLSPRDIDLIIFATLSPEHLFPGSGVFMQRRFTELFYGDSPRFVPALDIRNQCSGFLYGLSVAAGLVQSGSMKNVLLVGGETHSGLLDMTTRGRQVTSLFGDGAGAAIVSATDDPKRGLRSWTLGADGRHAESLYMRVFDATKRPFVNTPNGRDGDGVISPELLWTHMDGKVVFRHAVEKMSMALTEVFEKEKLSSKDIDLFVFHQANMRINSKIAEMHGIPEEKLIHNIHKYGNTTAATIPLLLWEGVETGRLKPGMKVALAAFGSGFTWGAAVMDW